MLLHVLCAFSLENCVPLSVWMTVQNFCFTMCLCFCFNLSSYLFIYGFSWPFHNVGKSRRKWVPRSPLPSLRWLHVCGWRKQAALVICLFWFISMSVALCVNKLKVQFILCQSIVNKVFRLFAFFSFIHLIPLLSLSFLFCP